MGILINTMKTDLCSLIFQMLASYIGPTGPKNFCDIFTWQVTRKLILTNRVFKSTCLIKMIKIGL